MNGKSMLKLSDVALPVDDDASADAVDEAVVADDDARCVSAANSERTSTRGGGGA